MRRLVLFILLLLFYKSTVAQNSYKEVDSISYTLYSQSKWKDLIAFQQDIKTQNFDYHLLNLRFGFAHFYIQEYDYSIVDFKRALANDNTSQVALEYLFWNYYYLADYKNADVYYVLLDKLIQEKIDYQPLQNFDFVYVESGLNFQKQKEQATKNMGKIKSLPYTNIGLKINLSYNFSLYLAYFFHNEHLEFTDYRLHRGYIKPSYKFKNNIEVGLGINYISSLNDIASQNSFTYSETQENVVIDDFVYQKITSGEITEKDEGVATEKGIYTNIYFTKLFEKFKVSPFIGLSYGQKNWNTLYTTEGTENVIYFYEDEEVYNENFPISTEEKITDNSDYLRYSFGLNLGYDASNKIGVGLEISTDLATFNYIPTILYKATDKLNFIAEFVSKGKAPLYFYNGLQLINHDEEVRRFGLISDISLTKKLNLYLAVSQQKTIFLENKPSAHSNTAILGLKFKL